MNCGSTKFHHVENGWKCDYCGTLFLNPKKTTTLSQKEVHSSTKRKKRSIVIAVTFSILLVLFVLLAYLNYRSNDLPVPPPKTNTLNSSGKNKFPGRWTQEIYDSVKAATQYYDDDTEKYSFENGSNYEELEKLVGTPDTVTSWEKEDYGMPPRAMATWNKDKNGERISHSITITYEKKHKMITDKSRY